MRAASHLRGLFLIAAALAFAVISGHAQTPAEYNITGTVFDESNQGVERVRVCATPADYIKVPQVQCALSDSKGNFLIRTGRPSQYNLPAPVQLSPADRAEFHDYPRHTKLEWQQVEGATYYLVEIDICDGRDRELRECVDPKPFSTTRNLGPVKVEGTTYEFDFVGRQPGRWRIWAIDGKGQEGFKSPWRTIFYLK